MPRAKKSRILIVDDHPAMREGLKAILQSVNDLAVCGEAENGKTAIEAIQKLQPDLVIVDISLREESDGIDLTQRFLEKYPTLPIIVFSLHEEQVYCDAALASGARGYCTKGEDSKNVIKAVRQVLSGKKFVSKFVGR